MIATPLMPHSGDNGLLSLSFSPFVFLPRKATVVPDKKNAVYTGDATKKGF